MSFQLKFSLTLKTTPNTPKKKRDSREKTELVTLKKKIWIKNRNSNN